VGIGVRVEGLDQLLRDLRKAGVEVNEIKDAMGKVAAIGAQLAAGFAPSRTGRLRRSIRGSRQVRRAIVRAGGARLPYVAPINYGWRARGITAAHFMQRVDEPIGPIAVRLLDDELGAIIGRHLS
jgi:hypothetical protein